MNEVNNYDTDDVVPRGSPLLAIRPRLEPEPLTDWEGDNDTDLDDLISDVPWSPVHRFRKRSNEQDSDGEPQRKKEAPGCEDRARVPLPVDDSEGLAQPDLAAIRRLQDVAADAVHTTELPSLRSVLPPNLFQTSRRPNRRRKRFALPLRLRMTHPAGSSVEIVACPDSGSDENIISLELVKSLGLDMDSSGNEPKQFAVANGKIVYAMGQVSTRCSFVSGNPSARPNLECIFHVFATLAVPLIMGMEFLQQTETLSKYRDRLVEQHIPGMQTLRVSSVGRPKRSLICQLDNNYVGCATVDTGSDLDLVSPQFAASRAYKVEPAHELVEFADCSVGYISGVITTSFIVGNMGALGFNSRGEARDLDLFVLDNLNADILIGQDTVDKLDVFNVHRESLIPSMSRLGESDLNIIRHIGSFEQGASTFLKKIKGRLGGDSSVSSDSMTGEMSQADLDQRENARRERERARIAKLSGPDKEQAQALEDEAIQAFEGERQRRMWPLLASHSVTSSSPVGPVPSSSRRGTVVPASGDRILIDMTNPPLGAYVCAFEGCSAPPFQTQYLLNSHANVHSSARPYYCTVQGCPRSKGGKGFRSKNEMIRHGLVHDSPGYFCPFCPDKEHKYPRPDNLQRHVRVHHVDKDKDDPLLRDVLSRRPYGPMRGRR